ncbi:hypothetical protein CLV84_1941 [Neolewinella xylanilytica]|uniref:Uncharacterized protein n=1 Tax=Neolewinella xylanilytica TaxID=1514080 RepID=A0A2S6I1K2_9BACT|nr:hypothetical protein [Neolewinella xylanilytica]PPK85052.1 hypothetical protein CLV84_1941 [Neolewinella xylanilytica]
MEITTTGAEGEVGFIHRRDSQVGNVGSQGITDERARDLGLQR